jgi:hypothetical protein
MILCNRDFQEDLVNLAQKCGVPNTVVVAIAMPGEGKVYAGSEYSAVRGQQLTDPGQASRWDHVAIQMVAAFASAGDAAAFVSAASNSWARCANRKLADPQDNQPDLDVDGRPGLQRR